MVSWNRWATDWFSNQLPELPRRYGQLVPANWSISYVFIGSSQIQFFAKSIMPLFTLFILLLPILLGLEFKSYGYFAAAILIQLMFKKFLGEHIYSGYVDTAVTFFSFASIYCLIKASLLKEKQSIKSFLSLGALLAGGAVCAKQPGLFILAAYPVMAYFLVIKGNKVLNRADLYEGLVYPFGIALAFSLPWYIYTEVMIYLGRNKTEFEWILEEVHQGRNLWDRFVLAIISLEKYSLLYLLSVISLPLLKNVFRWLVVFVILPYSVLWALYASYSHRNLAIVLPLLALASGLGLEQIIEFIQRHLARLNFKRFPVILTIVSIMVFGIAASLVVPDTKLIDLQLTQQEDILIQSLSREIYDYFETTDDYGLMLTAYPIEYLPGFEGLAIRDSFGGYEAYLRHRDENPGIRYLLMPKSADDRIYDEVMHQIETGAYELIFAQNNYLFVKIVNSSG